MPFLPATPRTLLPLPSTAMAEVVLLKRPLKALAAMGHIRPETPQVADEWPSGTIASVDKAQIGCARVPWRTVDLVGRLAGDESDSSPSRSVGPDPSYP